MGGTATGVPRSERPERRAHRYGVAISARSFDSRGMSRVGCLERSTVKSLAAGRCPQRELAAAHRHLAECARCRAAVVAAACGVEGPGETVLMKRSDEREGSIGAAWKVAAVAISVLAAGATWRFAAVGKAAEPRLQLSAQPPSGAGVVAAPGEPRAPRPPEGTPSSGPSVVSRQLLGSPSVTLSGPTVRPVAPDAPATPGPVESAAALELREPASRLAPATVPEPASGANRAPRGDAEASPARAERSAAAREAVSRPRRAPPATTRQVAAQEPAEEYDFGIGEDESASAPSPGPQRPAIKGRPIRTTLD